MSRRHRRNAKARHHDEDMAVMVEQRFIAQDNSNLTYEEAKWPFLSPRFRAAHNRLRQARGLPTLPDPAIDRYVPPPPSQPAPWDPDNAEWRRAVLDYQRGKYNEGMIMGGLGEGFEVKSGDGFEVKK